MLLRFYFLFFLTIISYVNGVAQSEDIVFQDVRNIISSNPDSFLVQAENGKFPKGLNRKQQLFLHALAAEKVSKYNKTDSLINYAITNLSFAQDSDLYYLFLGLLAEQKKITDDFEGSVRLNYRTLSYYEKQNDTVNLLKSHIAFGELYRAMENFDLGLNYLHKGERIYQNTTQPISQKLLCGLLNRRAAIFLQKGTNLDSVENLSLKVIAIAKEIGDLDLEATSSNEVGYLYLNQNKAEAAKYLLNAVTIWDGLGYDIYAANARLNLARHYDYSGDFQKALAILLKILPEVENSDWNWEKGTYYELLGRVYTHLGDYKKGQLYTEKAKDKLLDVYEKQYYERLAILSQELEVQKKEREIQRKEELVQEANEQKEQAIEERKYLYVALGGLLIFILALTGLTYYINTQRQVLKKQQRIIQNTNEDLKKLIKQKESLLKEVNHRVKNNLSVLTGLLYLQQKELESKEAIAALKDSQLRINTIALIHESLYQRDDSEKVDFQDYLTRLTNYISSIYLDSNEKVEFEISCKGFFPNLSNSIPLGMILNEFITNSFKYAFKKVEIPKIFISYSEEFKAIYYYDNGPGIKHESSKGSLGLKLVELFCQQINAQHTSDFNGEFFIHKIILN